MKERTSDSRKLDERGGGRSGPLGGGGKSLRRQYCLGDSAGGHLNRGRLGDERNDGGANSIGGRGENGSLGGCLDGESLGDCEGTRALAWNERSAEGRKRTSDSRKSDNLGLDGSREGDRRGRDRSGVDRLGD